MHANLLGRLAPKTSPTLLKGETVRRPNDRSVKVLFRYSQRRKALRAPQRHLGEAMPESGGVCIE